MQKFGKERLVLIGLWCWSVLIKAVAVVAGITVCYILVMVKEVATGFVVFPLL